MNIKGGFTVKKTLVLFLVACLVLLVGCESTTKVVNPYSSTIDTSSDEIEVDETGKAKGSYQLTGGDDLSLYLMGDEEETVVTSLVEKGTSVPTLQTKWRTMNFVPVESQIEAQATEMRNNIINSANTDQYYTWTGKTYYISPDGNDNNDGLSPKNAVQTIDADVFTLNPPQPGDAILFERGGLWRLTNRIRALEGVTYGSYGTGEKPTFYGSAYNYADEKFWLASKKAYVWKVTVPDIDIGNIVFNHGELVGRKRLNGVTSLENDGDFYYNNNDDTVYLFYKGGNPGKCFDDIEICLTVAAFGSAKSNLVIDNFKIKYFGQGGVYFGAGTVNTAVTHCEFGFLGGYKTSDARAGNCVQQWNNCDTQRVADNWMYQAYDTGYTFQGSDNYGPAVDDNGVKLIGDKMVYKDITVENNLIEYCNYAIEAWHGDNSDDLPCEAQILNFKLQNNILRYSGYGWGGMQRSDFTGYNFYVGRRNFKNAKGCVISGNIMDLSSRSLVYWNYSGVRLGEWTIKDNIFYQSKNQRNEGVWSGTIKYSYDQATLESAVSIFDSAPGKVTWVE